jgi:deoxyribodipyrimidine photolyase-related protein
VRNLVIVLGDQLNADSAAFDGFDRNRDAVWMAECAEESTHVWSHKARIALFLSAMRHFEQRLTAAGHCVIYRRIDDGTNSHVLGKELLQSVERFRPVKLIVAEPGEHRVREMLLGVARQAGLELEVREDRHFLCSVEEFRRHARGRKQLRMEYFYREMRKKHGILMEGGKPAGGEWNYDAANRWSFGKEGPGRVQRPLPFPADRVTEQVLQYVGDRFARHPGSLERFDWPVTAEQARAALEDFLDNRLGRFGQYQDAMWTGQAYLYHSRIAAAMNLKLLDPRVAIAEAEKRYREGRAPLETVEGFIRQILGWREYVRGIYWSYMPEYLDRNELGAMKPLPKWFWTGKTEMNCLRQVIGQTLELGYAHHIQRLMVTGLYCLLAGIEPRQVHEWYLAMYVDAVEWVELPNTLGMSQYADGGVMASKPYVATGKYIDRMSNYCGGCKYRPEESEGDSACPFTKMYWEFLARHREALAGNPRMALQLRNLERREELVELA